jgi:SPP1 family phage portal protein
MRFYDVDSGRITIDGQDINSVSRSSLRKTFGMVLQDTWLKNASVRDNIAYGVKVDDEIAARIRKDGILNLPVGNTFAKWLIKEIPDGYIQNSLERLRKAMYETCNHIDGNEKLQSNTSGTALRNRLVFLEQRCNSMLEVVVNSIYERIERLFEYLTIKNKQYDITDIKIVTAPSIPQDEISIIQGLSQLGIGTNISLETALSRLPFIENPAQEIAKIKQEQKTNNKIELDKIDGYGDSDE